MNSEGIDTPMIERFPCKLVVKPKNKAAVTAPLGVHLPKIKHARAIKPAPAVISLVKLPTATSLKYDQPIPATRPARRTFLYRRRLTSIPTLSAAIGSSPIALVLSPQRVLKSEN